MDKKQTPLKNPGLVLHQDMLTSLQHCEPEQFKAIVLAMGCFVKDNTEPDLQGLERTIFEAFRERLEYDRQSYLDYHQKQSDKAKIRWEKQKDDATAMPRHATALPRDATAMPRHATAMPRHATALPSNALLNGIELNNTLSHAREEGDAQEVSSVDTETSSLNTNTPLNTETPPSDTLPPQQRPTGGATIGAVPTQAQVVEYAKTICCPDYLARKFFNHYEANGWVTDGENPRPFKWQSKLAEWKVAEDAKTRTRHADISSNKKQTNKLNVNDEYNDL